MVMLRKGNRCAPPVQHTPSLPPPVALLHTKCMMLFHLDVFSSQTLRCCTTTWNSCCQTSSFWRRWRSVLLWRPLSSSATSLRTMSDRKLSWRSSWLLWLVCGSPQRCRGMGYFSFCWSFLLQPLSWRWGGGDAVPSKETHKPEESGGLPPDLLCCEQSLW